MESDGISLVTSLEMKDTSPEDDGAHYICLFVFIVFCVSQYEPS